MSVHAAVKARLGGAAAEGAAGRLPDWVKLDQTSVHGRLLRRLGAQRTSFRGRAAGARTGRSGAAASAAPTQRVVVKALVSRHAAGRAGGGLTRHLGYLARAGAGAEGERAEIYGPADGPLDARASVRSWSEDRHHFRLIVSPEHADRIGDLKGYIRATMAAVAQDLKEPALDWLAVNHFDTGRPHAHVLVRGRRADGADLVIPRAYMARGFRARAEAAAEALLGSLSRDEAERRVWRETSADRYTRLDRMLIAEAGERVGLVPDGAGQAGSYPALLRARLLHLQGLGLAERTGGGFRLDERLETRLRGLALRTDQLRAMNQRRLEGVAEVRALADRPVRGRVTRSGFHDGLGVQGYAMVRAASGEEYYARLKLGAQPPDAGASVQLVPTQKGHAQVLRLERGLSL